MAALTRKCRQCPTLIRRASVSGLCGECYLAYREANKPSTLVSSDRALKQQLAARALLEKKYAEALAQLEKQDTQLEAMRALSTAIAPFTITPKESSGKSEATAVWVASDWHVEEKVGSEVGGLNKYGPEEATSRATKFFQHGLRLTDLLAQDVKIHTIVLALLGDFISNDIHEEFPEVNQLGPNSALVLAQNLIISGIEFILKNSKYSLVIPCHSGNHARTTKTTRFTTENEHSLEWLMYGTLKAYFRNEPRVTFIIPDGMHSYVNVYDYTVRFHHGHAIRYAGGVGGITIPVAKAIAQWNKGRHADLDVFGHFHQLRDGGNFICNGSLIGYNAFALSIKADYEKPKQALFLIDKKRGRTCTWPILFT